jgi:hypothetical protein
MLACRLVVDWQMSGRSDDDDEDDNELDGKAWPEDADGDKTAPSLRDRFNKTTFRPQKVIGQIYITKQWIKLVNTMQNF